MRSWNSIILLVLMLVILAIAGLMYWMQDIKPAPKADPERAAMLTSLTNRYLRETNVIEDELPSFCPPQLTDKQKENAFDTAALSYLIDAQPNCSAILEPYQQQRFGATYAHHFYLKAEYVVREDFASWVQAILSGLDNEELMVADVNASYDTRKGFGHLTLIVYYLE
ncbi:MAG: hypothetical protein JKY49_07225 [Cohaesibacteraceae bacterium]|nr:hypothetical protein [Cohaesibacteraceae bacterium]